MDSVSAMKNPSISQASGSQGSPVSLRNRRSSVASMAASSIIEREQLASALDKIHTSASKVDSLTTFNDFAPPPVSTIAVENRGSTGDIVQQGFSGLYSRLREAVGVGSSTKRNHEEEDAEIRDTLSKKNSADARNSRHSISSLSRAETGLTISTNGSSHQTSASDKQSSTISPIHPDTRTHSQSSSKVTGLGLMSGTKSQSSSRQSLPTNATSSIIADPPVLTKEDTGRNVLGQVGADGSSQRSLSRVDLERHLGTQPSSDYYDSAESKLPPRAHRDDASSIASIDGANAASAASNPSIPSIRTRHIRTPSGGSSMLPPDGIHKRPSALERLGRSHSRDGSRDSSTDRGTAVASPVITSAHSSVYHGFSRESHSQHMRSGSLRIPGTTMSHEGATDQIAQLDRMRRQVLSKEFWMKDDTVKECFLCQTPFTAFRRKHHCRTCGCIFDAKCTTVISGDRFGVNGSLRVCKRCLEVISRRLDGSASEESGDEHSFMPRFFGGNHSKSPSGADRTKAREQDATGGSEGSEDSRSVPTAPMIGMPATRRVRDANRSSGVFDVDSPTLSRPGSSRSLKSLAGRPQSSAGHGHKRHHSKAGFLNRFKSEPDDRAPFRKGVDDEAKKKPKFPAFHDDNIIDPELADYMSDESSGDEQMSLFATMSTSDLPSTSYDNDKATLGSSINLGKKHRHRGGEKSVSGVSFVSKGLFDDASGPTSMISHRRSTRRRNLSQSGNVHHYAPSPRHKSAAFKGPSASSELLFALEHHSQGRPPLTSSDLMKGSAPPKAELNKSSIQHIHKLLRQLLVDADVPEPAAWDRALVPILLQSTDDVSPDVANRDYMDIRRYVKLKRIPGGKPGDTAYVSGVVFTKNLALKSMPRKISNPRIVLVTFPLEYQRHQQHFMSLQPVIEQEKEFLRVVVQRISKLHPHLLLAEKSVSGVALQYLSEANIAVAYNVKHTVIEAVSRCAETEIISSLDMLALPVKVGRCMGFEVRTFVNNDHPGRKKSYIYLSGCKPELGCTIVIRGAKQSVLARVKHIVEFMVYVVYNLKLESSLLRDESIDPPESASNSLSNSIQALSESLKSTNSLTTSDQPTISSATAPGPAAQEAPMPPADTPTETSQQSEEVEDALSSKADAPASQPAEQLPGAAEPHSDDDQNNQVPDYIPMPTFYSDMVAKYETKILSASPFVKFAQPYLLMKAREQERRLSYLRQLLEHDAFESEEDTNNQEFQLIKPEMVEQIGQKAPRQMREILRAVHDAEYDKALFNYQTQTRQWETYIQGNLDLFDPYSHQNIVVLYSMTCTETKIPCTEPVLLAINFYDDDYIDPAIDPDCTLGQYIEEMVYGKNDLCSSNGCERRMIEHHRSYVHDRARITVSIEQLSSIPERQPELGDGITMWTYCRVCKKDSEEIPMSELTFKYSFGKYLELLFWGRGLRMKDSVHCGHDHHRDHVRYFSLDDSRVRIDWDPIDLLEIVVPRLRITWKVANDIKLKNEIYRRMENRWSKFMNSVKARLKSIRSDSVLPEKAEEFKAELERLNKLAQEDQPAMVQRLQEIYVNTKYYEVVPFNAIVREMLDKAEAWDTAFAKFEADFLGDKDMRQQIMMQLKKLIADNDSKESLVSTEGSGSAADSEERPSQTFSETEEKSTQPTEYTTTPSLEDSVASSTKLEDSISAEEESKVDARTEGAIERVEPLDLASSPTASIKTPAELSRPPDIDTSRKEIVSSPKPSPRRPLSPSIPRKIPPQTSTSGQSLTEKVDQMRREHASQSNQSSEPAGTPISTESSHHTPDRASARRSGSHASPPLVRATSHPVRTLSRTQSSASKPQPTKESKTIPTDHKSGDHQSGQETPVRVDKKLSERLGLSALKNRTKGGQSNIPRLVTKKRESKVSALARHFEQLSREFEKERIRDRKKRAASLRQPRAMLPRASTKPFVEVYDDVKDAFEEPSPAPDALRGDEPPSTEHAPKVGEEEEELKNEKSSVSLEDVEPPLTETNSREDTEDPGTVQSSQAMSEDEGASSDVEPTVSEEFLPEIKEIADALEPSTEIPLELPKHQKTSLMKYLTNFWAERSASGWPALEYPINPTDHIFVDSDIIVREDEPSSVIALVLNSDDYQDKLARIRAESQATHRDEADVDPARSDYENAQFELEREMENSLLQPTGTHLKYQFKEGPAVMTCKIFYAEQFDALRRKCGVSERIIESLSRCLKWDSKGGKTKSVFLKTLDDRLVLKSLSPVETSAFLRFAPGYFSIMAEALFHDLPSVIAKMLGFFQVFIKNPLTATDIKFDLLITENLFYDRSPDRIFDLKGSMRNRRIQSTGQQNEVLLDENMVDFISESPLFAREHSKKLLRASVWNDTLFLARQNVMDYSLMIAVDETRKELVVGIIDCIRTYTWDKKLESWIKDRGFAGGGRNRPTVTSPKEYKSRFREAMARYILQSPTCWHLFSGPQAPASQSRARFEVSGQKHEDGE